jgi:hypothetical protein
MRDHVDGMREDILTVLHDGLVVLLLANRIELRDYARREIAVRRRKIVHRSKSCFVETVAKQSGSQKWTTREEKRWPDI